MNNSQHDLLQMMLDAIPSFILAVDENMHIVKYNTAAGKFLKHQGNEEILLRRGGEVLQCLHASESPQGCGHGENCQNCVLRNSFNQAIFGEQVVRRRVRMEILNGSGKPAEFYCLVTASPFYYENRKLVLIVIEDISEITGWQRIVPICMTCHKIRDDEQDWGQAEHYFRRHWDLRFSYGYCPNCAKLAMQDIEREYPSQNATCS